MEQKLKEAAEVATAFAKHFYETFDNNRSVLASLYVDVSILTFENDKVVGKDGIIKKLASLPFNKVQHILTTVDGHPTIDDGIMVHVLGQLKADEDQPHTFSETFYLKKGPAGYVVLNEIFRLSVHHG